MAFVQLKTSRFDSRSILNFHNATNSYVYDAHNAHKRNKFKILMFPYKIKMHQGYNLTQMRIDDSHYFFSESYNRKKIYLKFIQ